MSNFKIPKVGRINVSREKSGLGVGVAGASSYQTNLSIVVLDSNGKPKAAKDVMSFSSRFWNNIRSGALAIDLGSGLVTNVGVTAVANDWNWAAGFNTIKLANYHASGTGVTAAAATDIQLQTASANGGQTPVAGTQSIISAANVQKYQTVSTISYTGTEAVTEWGLFTANTLSATTGSPATASSATSLTATGTPYTASSGTVRGQQQFIVKDTTAATQYGLILSNTTSVLTVPAWYTIAAGTAGSTPGATDAFTIQPVMWDHKVFSAVNVNSGDSIQYTYALTINSGG